MHEYLNTTLNDLASFIFCTFKDFHLAAGEKQWIAYEITILGFFLFFASPTIVGSNKMLF